MQKIRITGFFFENRLHWQFEVGKVSANGSLRPLIYLRPNKTLIRNSLYAFDNWGKNLSHKKMWYVQLLYKMFTRRAKSIRIIGDPDNQLPDKWSSTVLRNKMGCAG
jgi:hypothetical protein